MIDNSRKTTQPAGSGRSASVKDLERRCEDRHIFTASAEVVELSSGARFSTRTTDLGPGGCFIDTTNPFPVGANVRVTIRKGKNEFHTPGTVVYSQYGLGMGISFANLDSEQRKALNAWIGEITGEAHLSAAADSAPHYDTAHHSAPSYESNPRHPALVRLVRLMITKGILTEAEGSSVLVDPVL